MKFTSETFGIVTGVRFYKSAANTGTHTGSLWSASGERLATATFTSETASGWQQVNFSTPVDVLPNTTYIVSYFAPSGHYADSPYYFYTPPPTGGNILNSPPLHAVSANAEPVDGSFVSANGLYAYSSTSTFPTSSFEGTNYWVDPVFTPACAPGQVTNVSATAGNGSASLTWSAPSSGGPVTKYTITPYIGSEAQATTTVTGTPPATSATVTGLSSGTSYTFTVQASQPRDHHGSAARRHVSERCASARQHAYEPAAADASDTDVLRRPRHAEQPPRRRTGQRHEYTFLTVDRSERSAESRLRDDTIDSRGRRHRARREVHLRTRRHITGIRFYKARNTGTHIGSLWSASGTLLASATFTGETASGWQQVNFSSPVAIAANTTYVAAYLAPNGHYSDTPAGFASPA